jgi:hypothetical protein
LTDRVALILDGNDASWESVCNTAEKLVNGLSVGIEGLWFAGNTKRYSIVTPRDFSEHIPGWYQDNRNRVTLLNPSIEHLERSKFTGMIALVTDSPPIDLEDWLDTGILERTVLVRTGSEQLTDYVRELQAGLSSQDLISEFQNPLRNISISAPGFAALCWESTADSRIEHVFEDGDFSLNVHPGTNQIDLHLKALGTEAPKMSIKRDHGETFEYAGTHETSWFRKPEWRPMTPEQATFFSALVNKEPFRCVQCDNMHEPATFICPYGDVILKGIPADELVIFTKKSYMTLSGWNGWSLCDEMSFVTSHGVQYKFIDGKWDKRVSQLCSAENVDDSMWAIYHRI